VEQRKEEEEESNVTTDHVSVTGYSRTCRANNEVIFFIEQINDWTAIIQNPGVILFK
jgi:hypothetical protein